MKCLLLVINLFILIVASSQSLINTSQYDEKSKARVSVTDSNISISWPTGNDIYGKLLLDLSKDKPLFKAIQLAIKYRLKILPAI